MKKTIRIAIVLIFIFTTASSYAQFGMFKGKSKASAPKEVPFDSLTFTHKINNIMEPSDHDEDVKAKVLTSFKNWMKDNLKPIEVLKIYALETDWTVQNESYDSKIPSSRQQCYLFVCKNTKSGYCYASVWIATNDFDKTTWDYKKKITIKGWNGMGAVRVTYKTDQETKDYLQMDISKEYGLDCATLAK